MDQRDMELLIEVEDELDKMDQALEQLAGHGHASGEFIKLDNVYDVIRHNAHPAYSGSEEAVQKFIEILYDRRRTPQERAEILLGGVG